MSNFLNIFVKIPRLTNIQMHKFYHRLLLFYSDLRKQPSSGGNIDALDGIRGLAVLLVIASHTNAFQLRGQGGAGVWLFFVLSGFLLSLPYAKVPEKILDMRKTLRFYRRRVLRIIPMYYCAVVLGLWLINKDDFSVVYKHIVFLQANGHLWSVPQELCFYLIMPLVFYGGYLLQGKKIYPGLLVLCGVILDVMDIQSGYLHNGKTIKLYIGIFLIGCAAGYHYVHFFNGKPKEAKELMIQKSFQWVLEISGILCLLFFFITAKYYLDFFEDLFSSSILRDIMRHQPSQHLSWSFPMPFAFAGAILILGAIQSRFLLHFIFTWKPLRSIGILGYSMYLIHFFILKPIALLGFTGNMYFLATLFVTYCLSILSYGFIERSFYQLRR